MHDEGTLQALTGGLKVKVRVQHPKILEAKFREGWMWFFRYYADEVQADGSVKTIRKKQAVGLSRVDGKITKKDAEVKRDKFLAKLNAPTVEAAVEQVAATGVVLLGEVARMYKEGYLSREKQLATPTREKQTYYLDQLIVPKWGAFRLNQIRRQAVEDWLHGTFDAWWTMYSVRAIMSRLYYYAEGYGLWEEGRRSPASRAKLGKKRYKYERRILSFEETARVLARLDDTTRLVIETCIATGARISEVLGLQWRHVNLDAATIKIEQRVWHQEVGRPKTEESRRVLGIGDLAQPLRARALKIGAKPDMRVFPQKCCAEIPPNDGALTKSRRHSACLRRPWATG
jgi:integrase